jgi:hypothetical protein
VATIVGPPGWGKTTLGLSLGLTVEAGGMWGGQIIKPRPLIWIAGEGQDDLRPIYEASTQEHPDRPEQQGWFYDEAFDFSIEKEVDKLTKDVPSGSLIIADALSDLLGSFNPDNTGDMVIFYTRVWKVVLKTNSAFCLLHHTGWDFERERNSSVIRQKSDIVALITEFNPNEGYIKLKHKKRRGGPMLDEFGWDTRLVSVAGYKETIPLVTGEMRSAIDTILNRPFAADEELARKLVLLVVQSDGKMRHKKLREQSGKPKTTFKRGLDVATKLKGWLIGGGRKPYQLNPDGCWKQALVVPEQGPDLGPARPLQGSGPNGPNQGPGPSDPIGPKVDPGPKAEGEPPTKSPENEVELEKWREMMSSLDQYR